MDEMDREIIERKSELLATVEGFEVVDQISYQRAGEIVSVAKELKKKIEDYFKPIKEQAYKTWKAITEREKEEISKVEVIEKKLSGQMVAWIMEQNRIKAQKEAELREKLRKEEEERRLEMAVHFEATGKKEEAEAILNQDIEVPAINIDAEIPKVNGINTREEWDFEIEDESLIPRQFLIPNDKAIRAFVKSTKGSQPIPGVKIFKRTIIVKGR